MCIRIVNAEYKGVFCYVGQKKKLKKDDEKRKKATGTRSLEINKDVRSAVSHDPSSVDSIQLNNEGSVIFGYQNDRGGLELNGPAS